MPELQPEHEQQVAGAQRFAEQAGAAAGPDLRDPQMLAQQAQAMELAGQSTEGMAAPGTEAAVGQSREVSTAPGAMEHGDGGHAGATPPPGDDGAQIEGGPGGDTPSPGGPGGSGAQVEGGAVEGGAVEGSPLDVNGTPQPGGPAGQQVEGASDEAPLEVEEPVAPGEPGEGSEGGEGGDEETADGANGEGGEGPQTEGGAQTGPGGAGGAQTGAQAGGGGAPVGVGGMNPAPWDTVSSGFDWDLEIAVRDHFAAPGPEIGPVAPAAAPAAAPRARGDMVTDALGQGALTGLIEGGKSIVIDTVINVASSKIPYVSGFVEAGRMIYGIATMGPGAYFSEMGGNLLGGGKFGEGWAKMTSGDPIAVIDGILDMADGVKTILDTLTSICWAVAGIGFVLSFIPGMQWLIPFVALAAKWGSLLGAVGTVMGAVISILRGVMIGLRTIDILYIESDPAEAEAKAALLQEDTAKFVQAWTERAGDSVREGLSGGPHPSKRGGDGDGPTRTQGGGGGAEGSAPKPTVLNRAGSALKTFAGASIGAKNFGAKNRDEITVGFNAAWTGTRQQFRGGQTTGQRIHGLETAGVDVYVSERHRDYTNRQLGADAADPSTQRGERGQAQADTEAARKQYEDKSREVEAARRDQADAQRTRDAAEERLRSAQERLRQVEAGTAEQRRAAEVELSERKALVDSYATDVQTTQKSLDSAQQQLASAKEARLKSYFGDPVAEQRVVDAQQRVDALQQDLTSARQGHAEAQTLYVEGQTELSRATAPQRAAQGEVDSASTRLEQADHYAAESTKVTEGLRPGQQAAEAELAGAERREGTIDASTKVARESFDRRMGFIREHEMFRDLKGHGADRSHLYGHNQGSGVTGFLTGDAVKGADWLYEQMTGEEETPAGADAPTPSPAPAPTPEVQQTPAPAPDATPTPEAAPPGPDYPTLIREAVQGLGVGLPEPPAQVPGAVDGAAGAVELINAEEAALEAQRGQIGEARAAGETSLGEIAEGRTMVEAGRSGVGGIEGEAEALQAKHGELGAAGQEVGGEASGGQAQSEEGHGLLGSFVGKFLELMGKVPSRFVGNAGAGASGAKKLEGAATGGSEGLQTGAEAGAAAESAATEHQTRTTAVKGQAESTAAELDTAASSMDTREQDAQSGLGELDQAEADLEAELETLRAERERLVGQHAADAQTGADWANAHQTERMAREAELDALITEAEAAAGGG